MKNEYWKVLKSDYLLKEPFFSLRKERCQLPNQKVMPGYYVIDFLDWVNVIPLTSDHQVIMIKQYRHGARDFFYEVPGGSLHKKEEIPKEAALRELKEETGYISEEVTLLGSHYPNPALQSNKMHTFIAKNCYLASETSLDPYEDIEVVLMSLNDVHELVKSGKIQHSIMLASLAWALTRVLKTNNP